MARRRTDAPITDPTNGGEVQPTEAPAVAPKWPPPAGAASASPKMYVTSGHPDTPSPSLRSSLVPPPGAETAAVGDPRGPVAPPAGSFSRPPLVPPTGAGRPVDFRTAMAQTRYDDVELDDQWARLPDDIYIEVEVKQCHYDKNPFNEDMGLQLRLQVTYPAEHRGGYLKDSVTVPDEYTQGTDQDRYNKIRKRMKMFLDACELLSETGESLARSPEDFAGQIVGCRTRNKDSVGVYGTVRTYTNVGFVFYRADKTPGLASSGETVAVPDKAWRPQG